MRLVLTTCLTNNFKEIRDGVLKEKLAACILEIKLDSSNFWWKGKICNEMEEVLLVFKTRDDLVDRVFEKIKSLHSYETPFIAEIGLEKVNAGYEKWLNENTTK